MANWRLVEGRWVDTSFGSTSDWRLVEGRWLQATGGGGPTTPALDTIEDAIFAVTGLQMNDGMASHFGKTASEQLHDAERRWLIAQGATPRALEDMWIEVHGPGEIEAVKLAYWNSQRP